MARTPIKNVLITGGAGFIGSHVTELFCDEGYKVTVIDDLSFGYKKFIDKRAKFIEGSIRDKKIVDHALQNIDIVIHLAASSIISFSYDNPFQYYNNNLTNGITLLEGMRKNNVKKIIYSSTAAVYGLSKKQPIPEYAPKEPISIYGSSKLAFEQALIGYYHAFGIESVSLRYFNAYGPRDEQQPITRAVPAWMKAICNNAPLPVYWQGQQRRDYVFVKDIAKAHKAVLKVSGCEAYNIGSGNGILMKDILQNLEKLSNKKLSIQNMENRKGDPPVLVADISKIQKEVGWKPTVSLEEGLKQTLTYYEKLYRANL